ncbi:S-adenosyl-L-methionine-dependent methyltransferase [Podospora appendiculata]|uniref:tRNA (adenine(58)-N(1))-methyltransferase catalytic subunit TRM61 n=1 Tax=Podospora appendiculata TaxID=314037 RepID=A0AAE0X5D5_9PEZI|nr:S-adenosyl-L-methionine-dependent methyltransferase [Podospora appendiculata]
MAPNMRQGISPFLEPGPRTKANSLAILQLSRDNFLPVHLQHATGEHDGYAEGVVVNTRFGSFPHSTMIGVPWGSQIRASKVDTGSRGRKRKRVPGDDAARDENENENGNESAEPTDTPSGPKQAIAASSGFVHVLPPTPEIWTTSLPHRTQVVYTPDYSYILHRIRARPGAVIIEAGAGSGSFSHASARAVYNGYPKEGERKGKVISFEYHEERYKKMKEELSQHGLQGIVHLTHRDVYKGGFLINDGESPEAEAVFLDLPAPWDALPALSRQRPEGAEGATESGKPWVSPLNPKKNAYICTFSPCIEQVTKTVSAMRRLGWVDIDMVEIANRKLHTARDRVGLNLPQDRGVNNSARDVEEAISKLAEIEEKFRQHARPARSAENTGSKHGDNGKAVSNRKGAREEETSTSSRPWADGRLIVRGEPEIKTHTSYLVFAILPREWSEEDEAEALAKYPLGQEKAVVGDMDKASRKKLRQELLKKQGDKKTKRKEKAEKLDEKMDETSG